MLRWRMLQLVAWWWLFALSMAQSDTTTDNTTPTTATDSSTATPSPSLADSTCTFLTATSCKQGICNYCARCIQQSCILANNTGLPASSQNTCSGRSQSTWYDYCVSKGNDSNGGRSFCLCLISEKGRSRKSTHIVSTWINDIKQPLTA
ncbi:hypothetical protein BGW37DRAFT_266206 [Umbelopsis sp. PMI_123]|nr:hypothetical protein BGW37DRAFT_266206 [Umbelopsis sp. PMI_123]